MTKQGLGEIIRKTTFIKCDKKQVTVKGHDSQSPEGVRHTEVPMSNPQHPLPHPDEYICLDAEVGASIETMKIYCISNNILAITNPVNSKL